MGFGISLAVYKPQTFLEVVECFKLGFPESRALCTTNLLGSAKPDGGRRKERRTNMKMCYQAGCC